MMGDHTLYLVVVIGSGCAGVVLSLAARVLWDRWIAPERQADRADKLYLRAAEFDRLCTQCQGRRQAEDAHIVAELREFKEEVRANFREIFARLAGLNGTGAGPPAG